MKRPRSLRSYRLVKRRGLSLLEAIIAIGIFVGAMAMIGQLLDAGLRMIDIGERETIALLRCESKMEEIVAGIVRISTEMPKEPVPDRDDPHWLTAVMVEPSSVEGLVKVTVTVTYQENIGATATTEEESPFQQSLTRMVVDRSSLKLATSPASRADGVITIPQMLGLPPAGGSR